MSGGVFSSGIEVTATAAALHPPGVLLDEHGHPVLDEHGEPVMAAQQPEHDPEHDHDQDDPEGEVDR